MTDDTSITPEPKRPDDDAGAHRIVNDGEEGSYTDIDLESEDERIEEGGTPEGEPTVTHHHFREEDAGKYTDSDLEEENK
jgi:hypothetical protein